MQTIFWASMLFLSGLAEIIVLYFHLSHDDLKKGSISALDVTESVRSYYPIEICLQVVMSVLLLINRDYIAFVFSLPMLLYNVKMILYGEYKCHAFFVEEYKARESIERISKIKTIYHCIVFTYTGVRFAQAFLKLMKYRIFG